MMWNRKVFIRIVEVLLCIACVTALRVTDDESRRVFHYLRNRSREWSLLNNVTWGSIGAALATTTCGGYIIVTTGLLIAAATGELSGRKTELFLLGLGVILFGIVGSLSLASIESVPEDLIDNAAVLGALCLLTALVFIADLLMSPPRKKNKHDGTQTYLEKETAATVKPSTLTTLSLEDESKVPKPDGNGESEVAKSSNGTKVGTTNEVFEDSEESRRSRNLDDDQVPSSSQSRDREDHFPKMQRPRMTEVREQNLLDRSYEPDGRQTREYIAQNFENGRTLRDSQRMRDPERDSRDSDQRRSNGLRIEDSKIFYNGQDLKHRPADELDTPLFPATRENMPEPMFAKIVNPSVKIMRVERDSEETTYDTRNSDSSQYDNVPTRMSGNPEGILKRHRDVSFNVPTSLRAFRAQAGSNKDDIEMLEEWINVLKTTNTQNSLSPSSPIDPGYVRHTASNWPRDLKAKTPGSSPERGSNSRP